MDDEDLLNMPKQWYHYLPPKLKSYYFRVVWLYQLRLINKFNSLREHAKLACRVGFLKYRNAISHYNSLYKAWSGIYAPTQVVKGRLEAFAETGTEGFVWMLIDDSKSGYEALVPIENGDKLAIFDHQGKCLFAGYIDQDHEAGYEAFPMNPEYGQPCAFDCWIHWTQKGYTPEEWASLFFHGVIITEQHPRLSKNTDKVPYRAILIKSSADALPSTNSMLVTKVKLDY